MRINSQEFITLGADVGGKDTFNATNQHVLELRSLLRQECQGSYGSNLNKIALVLRMDGSVQSWERFGVANISLHKRKAFATADIFVPVYVWVNGNESEFRWFLMNQVVQAIRLIINKANFQDIVLNLDDLELDLDRVSRMYLN